MAFIMLYIAPSVRFDVAQIERRFADSPHAKVLQATSDDAFACDYRLGDDTAVVRINEDAETIVIDGSGDAALAAALEIQACTAQFVHLIDEAYTFDLKLRDADTLDGLKAMLRASGWV